jgi:hypothetical protein
VAVEENDTLICGSFLIRSITFFLSLLSECCFYSSDKETFGWFDSFGRVQLERRASPRFAVFGDLCMYGMAPIPLESIGPDRVGLGRLAGNYGNAPPVATIRIDGSDPIFGKVGVLDVAGKFETSDNGYVAFFFDGARRPSPKLGQAVDAFLSEAVR